MKNLLLGAVALSAVSALSGCRGQTSRETPIFGIRNMYDQPRYDLQSESDFFPDHRTMRPLVEGVVAHDQDVEPESSTGRMEDQSGYVLRIPDTVIQRTGGMTAMLERGKARFGIYCAPCHDNTGSGEGLVKRRAVASGAAAFVPPTFHQDRIRHMPDGQLFATISNGKGNMPPYAMQIKVDDRWSIISYVRALQVAGPKLAGLATPSPTAVPGGTSLPAPGGPTATMAAPGSSSSPPSDQTPPPGTSPSGAAITTATAAPGSGAPATAPTPHPSQEKKP